MGMRMIFFDGDGYGIAKLVLALPYCHPYRALLSRALVTRTIEVPSLGGSGLSLMLLYCSSCDNFLKKESSWFSLKFST